MKYPFTEHDMKRAAEEWGCNCGPSALAFALQKPLDAVRDSIPDFEKRRYTSPTMMHKALAAHDQGVSHHNVMRTRTGTFSPSAMFDLLPALVRIQWEGPWTAPGSNPRWAYRYTHWITTWREGVSTLVFDCNGGVLSFLEWQEKIVPVITGLYKRATGVWYPTHVWRLLAPIPQHLLDEVPY